MEISVLKQMLLGGAQQLTDNKEKLNKMNVFPIPDGDTGTNMERTIAGAVRALSEIGDKDLGEEEFDKLYNGVLMSSQGNSGVILSQWFKGFFMSLKYQDEISAITLNEAFLYATESAYDAVATPVEGTFLTVAREAQENAEMELDEDTSTEDFLKLYLNSAKESLEGTPDKLPVLKEAGVVDSGGMGLVYLISGMLSALDEDITYDFSEFANMVADPTAISLGNKNTVDEFGYCTELIVQLNNDFIKAFKLDRAIDYLNTIGNSVVAVQDKNKVKIHVHTFTPEKVLEYFHQYGEFIKLKIENMSVQHQEILVNDKKKKAVVAVVNGIGIGQVFKDMGVDCVIERSEAFELSVGDISTVIKAENAENIVLLLDDKNLHLVAAGVKEACPESNIFVINSISAADEYAALSIMDLDGDISSAVEEMNEIVGGNITGVIKKSDEISDYNNLDIKPGDYIAALNDQYTDNYDNLEDTVKAMFENLQDADDKESILVFCQNKDALEKMSQLEDIINRYCPNAEIFMTEGNQESSMYIFAID